MKNLPLSLALAAFSGAFTLLRPADWSPGVRRAYVLAPGAAIGAITALAFRKGARKAMDQAGSGTAGLVTPETGPADGGAAAGVVPAAPASEPAPASDAAPASEPAPRMPVIALAGMAAVVSATVSGFLALSLVLDEAAETWLVRRGVARPRRVMAVAAVVGSLLLDQTMEAKDPKSSAARQ